MNSLLQPIRPVALGAALLACAAWGPAGAAVAVDSSALRGAVTLQGVRGHQAALQAIANANQGTRVAASPGHALSAEYVYERLVAAGYQATRQEFDFAFFEETAPSIVEQLTPTAKAYAYGVDQLTMAYSGTDDVTAAVQAIDLLLPPVGGSTSGCEAADFIGFTPGNIALIQRGTCTFRLKVENAQAAGARAVIIFNEGNTSDRLAVFNGTLGVPFNLPVIATSFSVGSELSLASGLQMRVKTSTVSETRTTYNVIAESSAGRSDRTVVVGAHLDSVAEGPGINDNGSGSAAILEIAIQIARLGITPVNKLRFAFWSAEESGLLGSQHYVDNLSPREIKDIALNLNFDMIGSPNFVRFVYDGDGSATPDAGPKGSKVIEDVFLSYFAGLGLPSVPTAFDGRSDYGPFIDVGIPAGGLFTGAEGIKTAAQAATYGGTAGLAYDPCYHLACDTLANNDDSAIEQMSDATAHAVLTFALTTSAVNGTDKGKGRGQFKNKLLYRGSLLQR